MIGSLVVAGIFALVVGVCTWAVVRLQRIEIAASKDDFERYKLEAGAQIAEANQRIEEQLETAQANLLTAEALSAVNDAGRENALTSLATQTVTEALAVAAGLTAREATSEATRSLYIISKVEPFAGKQFDAITTSSDIRLGTLLRTLTASLRKAGWVEVARNENNPIQNSSAGGEGLVRIRVDASRHPDLLDAAEALTSALNAEGTAATLNSKAEADTINPNVIHIVVGPKP